MRLWCLLLLMGCDPPVQDSDTSVPYVSGCELGPEPTLVVGKGEFEWEEGEANGGRTTLIHGMQGGFHTFLSVRAAHLSLEEEWALSLEGTLGGEVIATAELTRTPECNGEADLAEAIGTWLIWRSRPPQLHDQTVTITATVTDVDGRSVTATGTQLIWDEELAEE